MSIEEIIGDAQEEVVSARRKFPSNKHLLHAFQEEAGEVTKAYLDCSQNKGTPQQIRTELIQTIAMAIRLIQEGDADLGGVA